MNALPDWSRRIRGLVPALTTYRLVLLRAPAGYGKSTALRALASALEERGESFALLTFDKRDAEPARFFRRIATALGLEPTDMSAAGIAEVAERQENALPILLLDDIDTGGSALAEALEDVIAFMPALHCVVASREAGLHSIAKLRAQNELSLIGPDHLKLTRDEAQAYFGTSEDTDLMRLVDQCDGWPILLKLVRDGLDAGDLPAHAGQPGSVSADLVADFLEQEILPGLEPDDVDFIERTAIVSRFTLDLAYLLAPDARVEKAVERLSRSAGLLRPLHLNGLWYEINPMLRSALLRRLRARIGPDLPHIHRSVENWMIEHDARDEAVLHACLAHDYDQCVDLVRRFGPANLCMRYGIRTLRAVLALLPRHYIEREPSLALSEAVVLSKEGRVGDALNSVQRLRLASSTKEGVPQDTGDLDLLDVMFTCHADRPLPDGVLEKLTAVANDLSHGDVIHQGWVQNLICRVYLSLGQFAHAAAAGLAAERYYARSDARYGQFFIHLHLASTRSWQGLPDEVLSHIDSAESIAIQHFPEDPNMATLSRILRAELLFEQGQDDIGIDLLPALECAEKNDGWLDLFVSGYRTAALKAFRDGKADLAIAITRQAEEAAIRTGFVRLGLLMQILRAEILCMNGHRAQAGAALRLIRLGRGSEDDVSWRERLALGIATARVLIHSRQFRRATALLDTLEAECQRRGIGRLFAKIEVLRAILLSCSGSPQRAIIGFVALFRAGASPPSLQCLLEEGELMARLCSLVRHSSKRHDMSPEGQLLFEDLSGRMKTSFENVIDRDGAGNILSGREREILLSLAQGESNKSTAARLNLSEATVKFHLQRVYRKLGVHNRVNAVVVAQQQGLLY